MKDLQVDLHGYDVVGAIELAEQRVHDAYENGYATVELLHGAGDVAEHVEEGRGRIKWALRRLVDEGRFYGYCVPGKTWLKSASIVLYLKPNPRPRRENWAPEPRRPYR